MPIDAFDVIETRPQKTLPEKAKPERSIFESRESQKERADRPHETRRTLLPPELKRHEQKKEGKGILADLPRDGFELAKDSLYSDKKVEQLFGVMALELDEHTQERPISEWRPMQRALEYADWEDYSKNLAEETAKLKKKQKEGKAMQEEIDRSYNTRLAVMGIKEALAEGLSQREDKKVVVDGKTKMVSDKQIVTDAGAREAYFKKQDGLDATTIKTEEIQAAFMALIDRAKPGSAAARPVEIDALRQQWHKLEEKYKASKDAHGLEAIAIARGKIAELRNKKEPVGRREEAPKAVRQASVSRAESSNAREEERKPVVTGASKTEAQVMKEVVSPGMSESQIIEAAVAKGISPERASALLRVESDLSPEEAERKREKEAYENPEDLSEKVKRERGGRSYTDIIHENDVEHRARSESIAAAISKENQVKTELDKAKLEARKLWQIEKEEKMESLVDRRDEKGEIKKGAKSNLEVNEDNDTDWQIYGWEKKDKKDVIDTLFDMGVKGRKGDPEDRKKAHAVVKTLLLNGMSGKEALGFLEGFTGQRGTDVMALLQKFQHDEDVWRAFGMADAFEAHNRQVYESSEVTDIENMGWQMSFIYSDDFAENSDNPAWERRVLRVDEEGRKVEQRGNDKWYLVNSNGDLVDKEGKKTKTPVEAGLVKFELHEVAHKGNIMLAIRKRINWEQYKDENGKWNVFQLKLPDKRGFVQVTIESMLDAKDTAFSGSKKEAVPKWLLDEMEEKHDIQDKDKGRLAEKTVKEDYKDLAQVIEMEGYFVTMIRQMHLSYLENYTNEEELAKNLQALLSKSHLTRDMWGERPLWQFMSMFAADYKSLDKMDGILGGTVIDNYLGYYYISDYEMLERQFGDKKVDSNGNEITDKDGNPMYDTSGVKLFDFNGLRHIRNHRVDNVANGEYSPMRYDTYYDFSYNYKYDESGKVVDDQGRRFDKDKEGNVRDALGRMVIHANGDIIDRDAARGILGQVKKDGKPVWFKNEDLNSIFTVPADKDGKVQFEEIFDDDDKEVFYEDEKGKKDKVWQMRTELPRKNGEKFANYINFFQSFGPDAKKKHIVEQAISEAAESAGKVKLNPINKEFAKLIATNLVRFTGAAARNDAPLLGHKQMYDTLARFIHFRASRAKYIIDEKGKDEGKAGKTGNKETIGTFGSLVTEPMLAIVTKSWHGDKKNGGWQKPILEVFHELSDARREIGKATDMEKKATNSQKKVFEEERKKRVEEYRDISSNQLLFDEQAERHYFDNQLERAVRISKKIRGAEEIKLQDFGGWAPEIGFYFKQKEFQESMTGFMQDLRYDVKSYGQGVQYHMHARFWDYEGGDYDPVRKQNKGAWRTMSLAESRYNRQMYNHPEFKTNGKIDPWKVQGKQQLLYKRAVSEWVVGELVNSRKIDKMATGPRHDMAWYKNVLDALGKLPGDFKVSSKDMWNNEVTKPFFTKDLMKLIKKESHTSWGYLYGLAILKGLFYGKAKKEENVWEAVFESVFSIPKAAFTLRA